MTPGRPLLTRTTLILAVAAGGVLLGSQSTFFVARVGWAAYLTALMLLAVGLAALAKPARRR
jgi:hypothetical protein